MGFTNGPTYNAYILYMPQNPFVSILYKATRIIRTQIKAYKMGATTERDAASIGQNKKAKLG